VKQLLVAAAALIAASTAAQATDLVVNGSFETLTSGAGQLGYNTDATGWTVPDGGYTFVFAPGTADTTGSVGQYGSLYLWGPNNGGDMSNMLPASSPDGGNYVAEDGAFQVQPIQQTITGLTPGQKYAVSFYWGGAQQFGFTGDTTEEFDVTLGAETHSTPTLTNVSHGFTGWQKETFTYTATSGSEVLSFLANGTPSGEPPFSVLDGVSLNAVPEPATWAMMLIGVAGMGAVARRRRSAALAV
jgi:opacity protein-like surface antigen